MIGKLVIYNMEERQRVKIVDYIGSKKIEITKIDEKLKEHDPQIRLDTFIDAGLIRKVDGIVRDMMKEKGFQDAEVTHEIKEMPGGPKLVHLTFKIDEGPEGQDPRRSTSSATRRSPTASCAQQMKDNKQRIIWFAVMFAGRGTYQETKFDEDADKVIEYYRDLGYITRPRRRAGVEDRQRFGRQENPAGRAAHSDHRRQRATGSATSTSPATRS